MNHHDCLIWVQASLMLMLLADLVEVRLPEIARTDRQLRLVIAGPEARQVGLVEAGQQLQAINVKRVLQRPASARQVVRQGLSHLCLPSLWLSRLNKKIRTWWRFRIIKAVASTILLR
jgi:hypothetical protein